MPACLLYTSYFHYNEKLNAKLVPFHKPIYAFRGTKEDWELELMRKAQAITDRAFAEVITRIKPGMTELELQAELIYCMYKNGGTGLAFDPIVVSGPNTSLPHGVAGERVIQKGDFVTMDFGASYMGYCSDMTRTAVSYTHLIRHLTGTVGLSLLCLFLYEHPLPLPLGEVAERSEDGEGKQG